jgi:hypothetical protein
LKKIQANNSSQINRMINAPPVVGPPCFAFAGAIMALLVLLMYNPLELSGAHDLLVSPLLAPSTSNMSDTTKNTKPTLLLHVGPHKTSTTFLQCVLTNMMDTLALDNYVYFGRHFASCLKNEDLVDEATLNSSPDFLFERGPGRDLFSTKAAFSPTFLNALRETHSQGKNAILMDEGFNRFTEEQTQLIMDEFSANWNVKLIMNYRRLYEILPSYYNQQNKPIKGHSNPSYSLWPGETNTYGKKGKPLLPFDPVFYEDDHHVTIPVVSLQFARNSLNLEHPKQHTTHTFFIIFQYLLCRWMQCDNNIHFPIRTSSHYMSWIVPTRVVMLSCKKCFVRLLVIVCHIPVPLFN